MFREFNGIEMAGAGTPSSRDHGAPKAARLHSRGFTLVELLVVVGILALLMAILLPAVNKLMGKAEVSRAKADVQRVANAWQSYYAEYQRWPVKNGLLFGTWGWGQSGAEGSTGMPTVVQVMTNIMYPATSVQEAGNRNMHPIVTNFNPKGIVFMAYDSDAVDAGGNLVDPWGNPYFFLFDVNGDGRIQRGGSVVTAVYASVIVWSLGPDAVMSGDDINSWE